MEETRGREPVAWATLVAESRPASPAPTLASALEEIDRLREVQSTLTRILGAIDEYVYSGEILPDDGYLLRFVGPCRERFLGLSAEQAQTAVWRDFVHPDERDLFDRSHRESLVSGVLDVQYRLVGADGRVRWVRDRGRIIEEGGRHFLDGSVLDVSALHEAEEQLFEHVRDIEALAAAHRELAVGADPSTARAAVCRAVRAVCGAAGVGLFEPAGDDLVLVETDGFVPCDSVLPTSTHAGATGTFLRGRRMFVPDASADSRISRPREPGDGVASLLFEPVHSRGEVVGVVVVVWSEPLTAVPERIKTLLPLVGTEVATALERAHLVDRLAAAARTDALTGLPNRRTLDDLLVRELGTAATTGSPLALAVVDLDHFKHYNDTLGHAAGDALLRDAGRRWRDTLRSTDTLARLGGEEFVVVLPSCDVPDAHRVLEGLRLATPGGQTCSVGVAGWDGVETVAELLHRADQLMYAAKHAGRDRVTSAPPSDVPAEAATA